METITNKDLVSGQIIKLNTSIRLLETPETVGDKSKKELITIVNANEPDIFSMISLKQLITESRSAKRDFILAKVLSETPNDESFAYFYHGIELNKVLFKFETERRLLHRMKVRNPLNNLYIIGKVYYYKITQEDIDKKVKEKLAHLEKKEGQSIVIEEDNKEEREDNKEETETDTIDDLYDKSEEQKSEDKSEKKSEEDKSENNIVRTPVNIHSVTSLLNVDKKIDSEFENEDSIQYDAHYICTDEDFLTKPEIREYFRKNCENAEDFIFELDRRNNDLIALLDTATNSEDDPSAFWKKLFSFHITMLMGMTLLLLLLGGNPLIILILFPIAVLVLISFLSLVTYLICIRRTTFNSLAVEAVDDI